MEFGTTVETINISAFTSTAIVARMRLAALRLMELALMTSLVQSWLSPRYTGVDANDAKDLNDRIDGTSPWVRQSLALI